MLLDNGLPLIDQDELVDRLLLLDARIESEDTFKLEVEARVEVDEL
jgi:hypothetical protein